MVLSLPVLALLLCSALIGAVAVVAAIRGVPLIVGWDPADAGPRQLALERRALLLQTVVATVLAFQLVGLFLFVAAADRLHPLLPGAMCAAGTFGASPLGYPTLALQVVLFVLCALWLVVHRAGAASPAAALVRFKYLFLLVIAAGLAAQNVLQVRFFLDLDPSILTSCCATIFREEGTGLGAGLASLPVPAVRAAFFATLGATLVTGWLATGQGRSPVLFSLSAMLLGAVSIAAVVSWVAPGFYELPAHHCPFCLLASEHGFVGYPLYASLALAVVAGAGSGLVRILRRLDPWRTIRPAQEHRLCTVSMTGFVVFTSMAVWPTAVMTVRILRAGGS